MLSQYLSLQLFPSTHFLYYNHTFMLLHPCYLEYISSMRITPFLLTLLLFVNIHSGEAEPSLASSHSGQVLKEREGEFRALLADLAAEQTFSVAKFSRAIEMIRNCVSEVCSQKLHIMCSCYLCKFINLNFCLEYYISFVLLLRLWSERITFI